MNFEIHTLVGPALVLVIYLAWTFSFLLNIPDGTLCQGIVSGGMLLLCLLGMLASWFDWIWVIGAVVSFPPTYFNLKFHADYWKVWEKCKAVPDSDWNVAWVREVEKYWILRIWVKKAFK